MSESTVKFFQPRPEVLNVFKNDIFLGVIVRCSGEWLLKPSCSLTASYLRQILQKLDELNGLKQEGK